MRRRTSPSTSAEVFPGRSAGSAAVGSAGGKKSSKARWVARQRGRTMEMRIGGSSGATPIAHGVLVLKPIMQRQDFDEPVWTGLVTQPYTTRSTLSVNWSKGRQSILDPFDHIHGIATDDVLGQPLASTGVASFSETSLTHDETTFDI